MKYGLLYTLITRTTGFLARTIFHYRKTELNYICDLVKDKKNIRILDYGCNTGYLLNILKNKNPSNNFELCGADINPYALNYARKKYKDFTFFDINDEFFDKEKFDMIILSHVLEHIKDRDQVIANLKKILKENGTLIIAVPQERFRGDCSLIQWFFNILIFRFENPHVAKINYHDLKELLANNGTHIEKYIYTHVLYPFKSDKKRIDSWSLVVAVKNNL